MTCDQTQNVSLLIDGELTPSERIAIEQHLLTCAECRQAHEEFLSFRSQLIAYSPSLAPSASDAALARILSGRAPVAKIPAVAKTSAAWRNPLAALFESFTPRLAAVAALIAIAFTIGAITFLSLRSPESVANNNASTHKASTTKTDKPTNTDPPKGDDPSTTDVSDATAQLRSKGSKKHPSGRRPVENRRVKPEGERTAPVQPPRPQVGVPPTYAMAKETEAPLHVAGSEMLTARHLEQSELLLRSFRNVRQSESGSAPGIAYDRRRARQLLYQNIRLRREADDTGDVEVASLLSSLEPILLDIANLRNKPDTDEITAIRERVERKNLIALLQVNSTTVARAYD